MRSGPLFSRFQPVRGPCAQAAPGGFTVTSIQVPDKPLLQEWLDAAGTEYYMCGQCEGLHIPALRDAPGVIDSRLFLEEYGLLLTTELEVRPGALLLLSADMGRLNMDYPTLKIFLDVVDDALPQLVVAATCPAGAGLSRKQFNLFVATAIEAGGHLAQSCEQLNYLYKAPETEEPMLH